MPSPSPPAIIILGSGIAGLTLGRCLRAKNIPSVIYDRSSGAPRYAYGITLTASAYRPLLAAIGLEETAFRRRIAVDCAVGGLGRVDGPDGGESNVKFRALRSELKLFLREGLDVRFDHTLSSAQLSGAESIQLDFENNIPLRPSGSSTIIIDTTGVHSPLRQALLPQHKPTILPYAVFSGKRYLPTPIFQQNYAQYFNGGTVLHQAPSVDNYPRLEISLNQHVPHEDKVSISYIYSRSAPVTDGSDPLYNPARPLTGAIDIPEAFYEELEAFLMVSEGCIAEPFASTFAPDRVRADRVLHWLMRCILVPRAELETLARERGVMLIGDAAHATPILGGEGANVAINDAVALAEVIAQGEGREALAGFYQERRRDWEAEVLGSERRIRDMHSEADP